MCSVSNVSVFLLPPNMLFSGFLLLLFFGCKFNAPLLMLNSMASKIL